MTDYKKMYFELFNSITDAITLLQKAQAKAEELCIADESAVHVSELPVKNSKPAAVRVRAADGLAGLLSMQSYIRAPFPGA